VRVPLPIVLLLVCAVIGGLWWIRTKDMDFMTPSGDIGKLPDYVTRSYDSDPDAGLPDPVSRTANVGDTALVPIPGPKNSTLEFGDLAAAPGLTEYSEHVPKGAAFLIRLAAMLESQGEMQRALLAWERVIDSTEATPAELEEAGDALERLGPNLPQWNIDPEGDLDILLQFGSTRTIDETFSRVAQDVADFLRESSSDIVAVVPRITTSQFPDAPARSPIALYFTGPLGADSAQSNVRSVNPPPDDPAAIRRDILQQVYVLVQGHIATLESIRIPQPPTHPEEPERDFRRRLTRLHWQTFADSLVRPISRVDAPSAEEASTSPRGAGSGSRPNQDDGPNPPTAPPPPPAAIVEPE